MANRLPPVADEFRKGVSRIEGSGRPISPTITERNGPLPRVNITSDSVEAVGNNNEAL